MSDLILIAKYLKLINILESLWEKVNKIFFLTATTPQEIYDILSAFDIKTSLRPNSIPVYTLKISNKLTDIIYLSFRTGIFPDLCKLAGLYQSSKTTIHSSVEITDPFRSTYL